MFGLRITTRNCPQVNHLFEFDIDEYISLLQMRQMLKLPREAMESWTETEWTQFLNEKTLMELKIVESDEDEQQGWGELARNMLNSFSQSIIVNSDESLRRTVLLNVTRGNSLFTEENNCELDITNDSPTTKITYLFMVNRSTEHIGQYMKSDFALLRLTTEVEVSSRNSPQSKISRAMLEPRNTYKTQQFLELEEEKHDLESRLKEAQAEIMELQQNAETNDKIIRDKERQARSDKKQIEFLENDKKQVRGELRTCQEMLTSKETEVRDKEKELDDLRKEIKSLQKRLETVKAASDLCQDKLLKSDAENFKYKNMLTGANKSIKVKDLALQNLTQEMKRLNGIITKFSQLSDGKTMSLNAIRQLGDQH